MEFGFWFVGESYGGDKGGFGVVEGLPTVERKKRETESRERNELCNREEREN